MKIAFSDILNRAGDTAREVFLLLKKDAMEKRSAKKGNRDGWGIATTLTLAVLLIAALVYFVSQFSVQYLAIPWNGEIVSARREAELLTVFYTFVFLLNLVGGVGKIYSSVSRAEDIRVLQVLPVRANSIFIYKIFSLYLREALRNLVVLLPVCVTLGVVAKNGVGFYFGTLFAALGIPVLALFIASFIAVPMNRAIDWFRSRYAVMFGTFLLVIFAGFYVYAQLLNVLQNLLANGEIQFFFQESTMNLISAFTRFGYPANLFASLSVGENAGASFGILAAGIIVFGIAMFFLSRKFVPAMLNRRLEGTRKFERRGRKAQRQRSPFIALLAKESLIVFRTPTYAFQYFAIALLLPFMCLLSIGIVDRLLSAIVSSESGYEICVFVVTMFAMLTNTFSATNISRDGNMFSNMKTLPVPGKKILGAKVVFSALVSEFAILASVITLSVAGFVGAGEAVGVFVFVSALSVAEILYATRLDLNRPKFPDGTDGEITESRSVSAIALTGLLVAVFVGVTFVALSLALNIRNLAAWRPLIIGGASFLIAAGLLTASLVYFFRGLKARYGEGK